MGPSTPQPHRDMESITGPIHTGPRMQWPSEATTASAGLICFTPGQVRAANPNALSIRAHQGCMNRELWTTWEGGSIHFFCARSYSSACFCHKLLHRLKRNTCRWITPWKEVGFNFLFFPSFKRWKKSQQLQAEEGCIWSMFSGCWIQAAFPFWFVHLQPTFIQERKVSIHLI